MPEYYRTINLTPHTCTTIYTANAEVPTLWTDRFQPPSEENMTVPIAKSKRSGRQNKTGTGKTTKQGK